MATAKASVDIASAMASVAATFMISRWPGNDEGMPRGPVKSARHAKGLANRDGCPHHVARAATSMLIRELPKMPEAGYSPMGGAILPQNT
jgi:hypothetical protein